MIRTAALVLMFSLVRAHAQTIAIDPENPHYYSFYGKPTILVTSTEHYGAETPFPNSVP